MQTLQEVMQAAMALPEPDRAELVDSLIATFQPAQAAPLDDAWLAEIQRRSLEYDQGLVQTIPWEQVKQRARQRLTSHG